MQQCSEAFQQILKQFGRIADLMIFWKTAEKPLKSQQWKDMCMMVLKDEMLDSVLVEIH